MHKSGYQAFPWVRYVTKDGGSLLFIVEYSFRVGEPLQTSKLTEI